MSLLQVVVILFYHFSASPERVNSSDGCDSLLSHIGGLRVDTNDLRFDDGIEGDASPRYDEDQGNNAQQYDK